MNIAIIGAGPSGICAGKELLQGNPDAIITIFEAESTLGGTFSRSYDNLTLVNNPMMINFSDFTADETLPDLKMWTAKEYTQYLKRYVKINNLEKLIHFNSRVIKASLTDNRWHLIVNYNGTKSHLEFDYLVVCAGSNTLPAFPQFSGQEKFKGDLVHSSSIKKPEEFKGRNVLFIGLGETGSDLSELISEYALGANLSIRRWPGYLIPRYHDGKPTDLDTSKLYHSLPSRIDSSRLACLLRLKRKLEKGRLKNPTDRKIQCRADKLNSQFKEIRALGPFRRASTKNCSFIHAELNGKVILRPAVTRLDEDKAYFTDGSSCKVDTVIACTGYRQSFPFFDEALQDELVSSNSLYNYMFPPTLASKVAFIGYVRPAIGTVPVLAEMQSRLLAMVLNRQLSLPPLDKMHSAIAIQQKTAREQFPVDFERLGHLVDYYGLLKSLADQIGVIPNQRILLLKAPKVWWKVNFSFLSPAMFRLHGPGNTYHQSCKTIKKLPTMPLYVLAIEGITWLICVGLTALGLSNFRKR
ncbi:NAD(P)-binding domain-containing protein [Vibrio mediterranei]|uniref:NAD(P)-binding domain-containing protein n=1 Tax=Vibrio mediterranei TaxID=689 RepID=UPI00148B42B3|nr:NAD(P)-binding domain-containing protein [Vibrio mediterranei]NOI26468.1 SidA/IucD/PvdA family monooxygenase [Vibrio mediterranei]